MIFILGNIFLGSFSNRSFIYLTFFLFWIMGLQTVGYIYIWVDGMYGYGEWRWWVIVYLNNNIRLIIGLGCEKLFKMILRWLSLHFQNAWLKSQDYQFSPIFYHFYDNFLHNVPISRSVVWYLAWYYNYYSQLSTLQYLYAYLVIFL